jgi:D-alanyl-D-alanine carboxypeptidase
MFRAIASLMLFGVLSPVSPLLQKSPNTEILHVAAPSSAARLKVAETFTASGAIVVDARSGQEVFGLSADLPRSMGSLTKLMTAIVILENHNMNEVVTVPRSVLEIEGNTIGLRPGERFTIRDLLYSLLIASANDAAHTLAIEHSDDSELFAEEMNKRALALGLQKTHFKNPMGFDSAGQVSTPRELAWLAMYALKNDFIRSTASKRGITIYERTAEREIALANTNRLLSSHPSSFFGLKTGTTDLAGECLISLAYAGGRPYILVVLKSADRYSDTLQLFDSLSQTHKSQTLSMNTEKY